MSGAGDLPPLTVATVTGGDTVRMVSYGQTGAAVRMVSYGQTAVTHSEW